MPGVDVDRTYERSFVFMAEMGDTLLLVPWLFRADAAPDSVHREAGGWLARGAVWEPFYRERWTTPPSRAQERILPRGSLSVVVRDGDLVDGLIFQDGPRNLEVTMGVSLASWVGPAGETLAVTEGAAFLSDERVDGLVLDLSRSWTRDAPPAGDWAFLVSGDSVLMALTADIEHELERDPVYRGWAQRGSEDLTWPRVRVNWADRQAFPPARRDVPTVWSFASDDGSLSGTLRSVGALLEAGEGSGPILPVRGLIEVSGVVSAGGGRFPVRGLLVHQRR
jgi:hypothetical protein